jgi:protein gp37
MASSNTTIEWCDRTWNPLRGCTRVSTGCTNCYAEKIAGRFSGKGQAFEGLAKKVGNEFRWTGKIMFVEKELETPLHWKKPARIFVNSVSDLFHEKVPFDFIDRVFETMCHPDGVKHTYQILTKRPERMLEYFNYFANKLADFNDGNGPDDEWLLRQPHIWLGVSVENQEEADKRIPILLQIPVAVKFLSCEPLLSPLDLKKWLWTVIRDEDEIGYVEPFNEINWIIAGGESGPKARPSHPDWFRDLQYQCEVGEVAFLFKQYGNWLPSYNAGERLEEFPTLLNKKSFTFPDGITMWNVGKKAAGRELDGRTWDEMPLVAERAGV